MLTKNPIRIFKQHLQAFIGEAVQFLREERAWPPPLWGELDVAGSSLLYFPLIGMESMKQLEVFLNQQPFDVLLEKVGYRWVSHRETIPMLFLEQLARRNHEDQISERIFDEVFDSLIDEIRAPYVRLRQVTSIHGFPLLSTLVSIGENAQLVPFWPQQGGIIVSQAQLWDLLEFPYQRQVSRWITGTYGAFLVQDVRVKKAGDGTEVLEMFPRLIEQRESILGALRLSYEGLIHIGSTFQAQMSKFPLLPLTRSDNPDVETIHSSVKTLATTRQLNLFKQAMRMLRTAKGSQNDWQRFQTAFDRFNDSFRLSKPKDNVIDLVVALEGLFNVQEEELRRRLALRSALILGNSDEVAKEIYDHIQAAYGIRNNFVHGRGSIIQIDKKVKTEITRIIGPAVRGEREDETRIFRAANRIRDYVRRSLWAFVKLQGFLNQTPAWPNSDEEWDNLVFDVRKRRKLSKMARV